MKTRSVFVCSECGYQAPKFYGRCPSCGEWETMAEKAVAQDTKAVTKNARAENRGESHAVHFTELEMPQYMRSACGMKELDRVLGGGIVEGSVILIAGEPGIGKSTLLMQISGVLSQKKTVLYVSGEESGGQLKYRADRLGLSGENLYIMTETSVDEILSECEKIKPDFVIVDSVQTMYCDTVQSSPGSVTQVKESAMRFIALAKNDGISVMIVGHVNKEGSIAGPKVLEHMVDAVLCFEGEKLQSYRIIRANKNRFGSTNEIGVFEMTDKGLIEVGNPSEMLLSGRPKNTPGNCAMCTIEGTRPIIAEVQALVSTTVFPAPRRTANGIDHNRLCLIIAVLEKRLGLKFYQNDVYTNVIGGLYVSEPASDAAIALALISSLTDKAVPDDLIAIGELGLSGECRAVSNLEQRVKEAARLGFTRAVVPFKNIEKRGFDTSIELIPIHSIFDALKVLGK